jgi:hypothetical protein
MSRRLVLGVLLLAACGSKQPAGSGPQPGLQAAAATLPASNRGAPERLAASPRHGEWVKVALGSGSADSLMAWVVYPESRDKAPVVIVEARAMQDESSRGSARTLAPPLGRTAGSGASQAVRPAERDPACQRDRHARRSDHRRPVRLARASERPLGFPKAHPEFRGGDRTPSDRTT